MDIPTLPPRDELLRAFTDRDEAWDGLFVAAVRTTGVFCRPVCPARKPRPENVDFFPTPRDALHAGYRPCLRCRPLDPPGTPPSWLRPLLEEVEADPERRWSDASLRERGLSPERVRRWFKEHHGMTFHAYSRARRLGRALGRIRHGEPVTRAAFEHGYESLGAFNEAFRKLMGTSPTAARNGTQLTVTRIPTPLGPMVAAATPEALCLLEFSDRRALEVQIRSLAERLGAAFMPGANAVLDRTVEWLERYFAGEPEPFGLPLHLPGTDFQRAVWAELRRIPPGETVSYGEVSRRIERPGAVRAVGRAVGRNRVAVVVPCHRVVGADGRLTGYGGGLWRKKRLLAMEAGEPPEGPAGPGPLTPG